MNLCKDCKFYQAGETENDDMCRHVKAFSGGGVRQIRSFPCVAMRVGICSEGKLFEPKEAA